MADNHNIDKNNNNNKSNNYHGDSDEFESSAELEENYISFYHKHHILDNQVTSVLLKRIRAPVDLVWSIIRKFEEPQCYKPFVQSCTIQGEVKPGVIREVCVISGLPASTSSEMLEILDDENHVMSYKVLGGDHRLKNYKSIATIHPLTIEGKPGSLVLESYSVDVPDGNTKDDTKFFVEALIKVNLKSLADLSEQRALSPSSPPKKDN